MYGGDRASDTGLETLQRAVTRAIEDSIFEGRDGGLPFASLDEFRSVCTRCWRDFLENCCHFWRRENAPLGLVADPRVDRVWVVRGACVELVRPCDPVEAATLPSVAATLAAAELVNSLEREGVEHRATVDDVHHLLKAVRLIRGHVGVVIPQPLTTAPLRSSETVAIALLDGSFSGALEAAAVEGDLFTADIGQALRAIRRLVLISKKAYCLYQESLAQSESIRILRAHALVDAL